jgi:hypothetical protein
MKQKQFFTLAVAILLTATTFAKDGGVVSLNLQETGAANPNPAPMSPYEWGQMLQGIPFARVTMYCLGDNGRPAFDAESAKDEQPTIAKMALDSLLILRQDIALFEGNDDALTDSFWSRIRERKLTLVDRYEYGAEWRSAVWVGLKRVLHQGVYTGIYGTYQGKRGDYPIYNVLCGNTVTPETSIKTVQEQEAARAKVAQAKAAQAANAGGMKPGNGTDGNSMTNITADDLNRLAKNNPGSNFFVVMGGQGGSVTNSGNASITGSGGQATVPTTTNPVGVASNGAVNLIPGPPQGLAVYSANAGTTGYVTQTVMQQPVQTTQPPVQNQGIACASCPGSSAWTRQDVGYVEHQLADINGNTKTSKNIQIAGFVFDRAEWLADRTGVSGYLNVFGGGGANGTTSLPTAMGNGTYFGGIVP